ncbi:unnamed protein product [Prorocentrum cordatum]|uniref:PSII 6.1 kDa protein n=2 Tax=Prorocentrum cordatum TaxID=2364126 RepID=A0ABN9UHR6_9DINO|nr:unnamed protein product [Polarella glacialis]
MDIAPRPASSSSEALDLCRPPPGSLARRNPMAPARPRPARPALLLAALALAACRPAAFLPPPAGAPPRAGGAGGEPLEAYAAVLAAASAVPAPALAIASEDDDGFDVRILAVLALPLLAASWALFNVWRVAFRQGARIGEGVGGGNSKIGLAPEE